MPIKINQTKAGTLFIDKISSNGILQNRRVVKGDRQLDTVFRENGKRLETIITNKAKGTQILDTATQNMSLLDKFLYGLLGLKPKYGKVVTVNGKKYIKYDKIDLYKLEKSLRKEGDYRSAFYWERERVGYSDEKMNLAQRLANNFNKKDSAK